MMKKSSGDKKYSKADLEKIRKRAAEIWKGKCQALNTALDDWLQAERELMATIGIRDKKPDQYTSEETARIRERAQAIRETKVASLRTAFDDWIEAEQELKEELKKKKIDTHGLFDRWFSKASPGVTSLLKKDTEIHGRSFNDILEQKYVDLMTECMK
jgi:tRNA/tmRNA/rRNA uracil-C5-methylase (TrmA/RlmC/RlmD family)